MSDTEQPAVEPTPETPAETPAPPKRTRRSKAIAENPGRATMAAAFRGEQEVEPIPEREQEPAPAPREKPRPDTPGQHPARGRHLLKEAFAEEHAEPEPTPAPAPEPRTLPPELAAAVAGNPQLERAVRRSWFNPQLSPDQRVRQVEAHFARAAGPPQAPPADLMPRQRAYDLAQEIVASAMGIPADHPEYVNARSPEDLQRLFRKLDRARDQELADLRLALENQRSAIEESYRSRPPQGHTQGQVSEFGNGAQLPNFQSPSEVYRHRRALLGAGFAQARKAREQG